MKVLLLLLTASLVTMTAALRAHAVVINLQKAPRYVKVKKVPAAIILDARPAFSYATAHLAGAFNIRWQDYSQTDMAHVGDLDPDVGLLARKLRIMGIISSSQVIVTGDGPKGDGADGRVAWMLNYLGVPNVTVKNFENMPGKRSMDESNPPADTPSIWIPQTVTSLRIEKRELEDLLTGHARDIVLIDVREPGEFSGATGTVVHPGHIKGAVNVSWKEFYGTTGEVMSSANVALVFQNHHIDLSKTLIFYSNKGLRSGLVTFLACQAKLKARNYDGSFIEWAADSKSAIEN